MDTQLEWSLIRDCRAGRTAAFEPLVRHYEAPALALATALLGDADEAADAVQDAFVRAYRTLGRLEEGSSFGGWFRTILRHRCLDELRSARRRRRAPLPPERAAVPQPDALVVAGVAPSAELAAAVHAALATLSAEHRETLVLKEIEGLSYAEIARTTGVPEGTIASRLYHARRALQRALAPNATAAEAR